MTQHPYCYPGTDVYRNKLDIRDVALLDTVERLESLAGIETLSRRLPISVDGYKAIHHYIFQNIYEWAGEYRRVDTGRAGAPFCRADFIATEMDKRFAAIHAEKCLCDLDEIRFAERAAEHVGELNAIHPFLDGNGRTLRSFLDILAERAGHDLDLARIDAKQWNDASIVSFRQSDCRPMRAVIAGAILS